MRRAKGLGQQPHFDAELRHARRQVQVAAGVVEVAAGRAASGPEVASISRRGERAQESDRQERELKAGVEQLLRVEHQKAERDRRQQVQRAAARDRSSRRS